MHAEPTPTYQKMFCLGRGTGLTTDSGRGSSFLWFIRPAGQHCCADICVCITMRSGSEQNCCRLLAIRYKLLPSPTCGGENGSYCNRTSVYPCELPPHLALASCWASNAERPRRSCRYSGIRNSAPNKPITERAAPKRRAAPGTGVLADGQSAMLQ